MPYMLPSTYPRIVDEVTVRLVAGVVLLLGAVALLTGSWGLYAVLACDFVLRAAFGPRLSPLAQVVLRFVRQRVPADPRPTAGPPKRFAATIGAVLTTGAAAAGLAHALTGVAWAEVTMRVIGVVMVVFPFLEAAFGVCVGCLAFARLMAIGVVPEQICADCADISRRARVAAV